MRSSHHPCFLIILLLLGIAPHSIQADDRPNILFIFSDDHAVNAISAYGSRLQNVAPTPHIDRIAREGAIFRNSFCANSICGPSRATVLTGLHSHKNGRMRNGGAAFDGSQWTCANALQEVGYQTAVIGKWHLRSDPVGFDYWEILPGQGNYYNPVFIHMDGSRKQDTGYATDLTTDKALAWLESRDKDKPFFLMCQHKAPHRTFAPALRHLDDFDDVSIPEPDTLFDQYLNRSKTLAKNEMEIDRHFDWAYDAKVRKDERGEIVLPKPDRYGTPEYNRMNDEQKSAWNAHFGPLNQQFLKDYQNEKLSQEDIVRWKYQRYMKNYLGTVKGVDENVGRMLQYLDQQGLTENTIVIYSSDQGFYLGEHGWYDKRWMFEESFKMPFVIRWPGVIQPGSEPDTLIQNNDYAPTFAQVAGAEIPESVQGKSLLPVFTGNAQHWDRDSLYYAYYEIGEHAVPQHFGVRTDRYKLIYFPATDEWNMFDLQKDPQEMTSVFGKSRYRRTQQLMTDEYHRLRKFYDAPLYENVR